MPFPNAFPMVYFFILRRVSPIKSPKGRAVSLLHLIGALLCVPQYKSHNKTPPPISCAENNTYRVDYPCACGTCTHSSPLHFRNYVRSSLRTPTLHYACIRVSTSAPRGISIPFLTSYFRSLSHTHANNQRISSGCLCSCGE